MTPELSAAIEDAYRVFAPYTIGSDLDVCRCSMCVSSETERQLVTTPLRAIPCGLLSEYTHSARDSSERAARELRYFLPRYFELIANDEFPSHFDLDVCLRPLADYEWRKSWPVEEVRVIERWLNVYTSEALQQHDVVDKAGRSHFYFESLLSLWVTAGADLDRLLGLWDSADDLSAGLHMATARIAGERIGRGEIRFDLSFINDYPEAIEKITRFLNRPETWARITMALDATDDPILKQVLSDGV